MRWSRVYVDGVTASLEFAILNSTTVSRCRLPTEAEWEMAALCVPSSDGLQQNDDGTGPYKRT